MFLDTSGMLIVMDVADVRHARATELFQSMTSALTHNYVFCELIALAQARGLRRDWALDFIETLVRHPRLEVAWVDSALHEAGMALLRRQLDKTYSLCDAISFILMRERGVNEALTADRHFEQAGWTRLLPE